MIICSPAVVFPAERQTGMVKLIYEILHTFVSIPPKLSSSLIKNGLLLQYIDQTVCVV